MSELRLDHLLDAAIDVAYAGGRSTLGHFQRELGVDHKKDGSPVTIADREAERLMRDLIRRAYPTHTVVGEEAGVQTGDPNYRWILDPIDGTRTFVRGVPLYGTLVAVEVRGEPAVGVIYIPALDEMVSAGRGLGCRHNGRSAQVSPVSSLEESLVVATDVRMARARGEAWAALERETAMQRTWADCYGYVLVATGRAEVALDPAMEVWDCAALLPVIEEAGGCFTSWQGERTIRGGDAVATNGILHDAVLRHLRAA